MRFSQIHPARGVARGIPPVPHPVGVGCRRVDPYCCEDDRKRKWAAFRRANRRYLKLMCNMTDAEDIDEKERQVVQTREEPTAGSI